MAPTGHKYYYHAESKQSTYTRPGLPVPAPTPPQDASASFYQYSAVPNLSDPRVANAYLAQLNAQNRPAQGSHRGGRGGGDSRPRPQPVDKPRSKVAIPGCEPWILVYTRCDRRFVYNPVKNTSYWRIPEKLMAGILELDKARLREKAMSEGPDQKENDKNKEKEKEKGEDTAAAASESGSRLQSLGLEEADRDQADDSSEYEEVEVTDDEADGDEAREDDNNDDEHPSKRQRTEEPVEFSEADIAFQLQAMGEQYGLDPGEYDDGNRDEWPEGAEGVRFSEEDARALFRDLLDDFNINPYNAWEKLIEDGRIIDDPRYTVLNTMKARKEVWQDWSKDKIKEIRERRAKEEKKDPRLAYMALLHEKASPKLFWAEFKRRYRKEPAIADPHLKDKDREKWYREHVNRLKMPQATLKADLAALLKSLPPSLLNNKTRLDQLPTQLLVDMRYISLPAAVRDPLIETYIRTLGPPPDGAGGGGAGGEEEDEASRKAREAKERRERALREHERNVAEQKKRQQRSLEMGRARLREEQREIERAMQVGKEGLQSPLAALREKEKEKERDLEGGAS
ncbi:hypothetical protein SODALDRAFT_328029 [Sodiomyces alkalinus F11]|uniref:FF domain-containing protein n=1 Tax=Sodiomyces alkalinus (strain CBS 110278 / VKM F-3762 / F11) TaxID=1314773 RepID=A0A3N2QB18_SODAK|nr:hypothetical protein SODALDRAFT_328029 [Sodiomyces alkalinus F11]ROT43818.1 hypothetical protein SODALDRAFT_328029 [Sodiomyces alkalinus F11]